MAECGVKMSWYHVLVQRDTLVVTPQGFAVLLFGYVSITWKVAKLDKSN